MRATVHISHAVLILTLAVSSSAGFAQASPDTPAAHTAGTARPPAAAVSQAQAAPGAVQGADPVNTASSLLKPSLTNVQGMLNDLKLDKWKKGSVREEAGEHVASLLKDLQTNLPPLLTAADAAPGQVSAAIPLIKHLDAFYDVLLRVEEGARVSAPGDQVGALQQTMLQLNQARLALDDQLQSRAAAQEKQVGDLQVALRTARAAATETKPVAAAPVPCKPPTPAKKKTIKKPAPNGTPGTSPATTPGARNRPRDSPRPRSRQDKRRLEPVWSEEWLPVAPWVSRVSCSKYE